MCKCTTQSLLYSYIDKLFIHCLHLLLEDKLDEGREAWARFPLLYPSP